MKAKNTKITAIFLACFLGLSAVGCSSDTTDDSSKAVDVSVADDASDVADEENSVAEDDDTDADTTTEATDGDDTADAEIATDSTDYMVKEIEFTWGDQTDDDEDSTEAQTTTAPATTSSASTGTVTSYAQVTDANGAKVTEEGGKVVTEVVTVPASNSAVTEAVANNANDGATASDVAGSDDSSAAATPYTPKLDTFQAYWMDMSKSQDITFNGDMIAVTFRVKDTTPDGNYVIHVSDSAYASEFANWDANALVPSITNGCITVGDAEPEAQTATNASDFVLTADSVTANAGDEVTVTFSISDNPGMVAFVFRFQYDSNALEIVDAEVCDDCSAALRSGLNQ